MHIEQGKLNMFGDWCMHVAHLAPSPSTSKGPGAPRLGKPPMLKSISELRAWVGSQSCSRERFLSKRSKSSLFMEPSVRVFTQNSAVESSYSHCLRPMLRGIHTGVGMHVVNWIWLEGWFLRWQGCIGICTCL